MSIINLCGFIKDSLAMNGYHVHDTGELKDYFELCQSLGKVTQILDVKISNGKRQYANIPDEVPYHTDHPSIPTVAWHCLEQDNIRGDNLLIDSRLIVSNLSRDVVSVLESIDLRMLHRTETCPILVKDPFRIYWLPMIIEEKYRTARNEEKEAIEGFRFELDQLSCSPSLIRVRLKPGQSLFINNNIFLHGRQSLPPNSKRHLVRSYIL